MRRLGLAGVVRRPTSGNPACRPAGQPSDLVGRAFGAPPPKRLWVADITYVRMGPGF